MLHNRYEPLASVMILASSDPMPPGVRKRGGGRCPLERSIDTRSPLEVAVHMQECLKPQYEMPYSHEEPLGGYLANYLTTRKLPRAVLLLVSCL